MVSIAGDASRLRPHLKTHKMREVVELQIQAGITKFKAATIAEVEMACQAGAADVLLAHQAVGPKVDALSALRRRYPQVRIGTIVDDLDALQAICAEAGSDTHPIPIWIDVDCGMGRTGIVCGAEFDKLRTAVDSNSRCMFAGLHVYDGHIHDSALSVREDRSGAVLRALREYLENHSCPALAVGGTPTFPIWARETDWDCCPGTSLLWDVGYAQNYPDLKFKIAAAIVTRVVSKPGNNRLCLDLGHKAIAAEMPLVDRVVLPTLSSPQAISHSEEHLVISTPSTGEVRVGDALIAYPRHICPTVALYEQAVVIQGSSVTNERWDVTARTRLNY